MAENRAELLTSFNFRVNLRRSPTAPEGAPSPPAASTQGQALSEGGFQECNGLDIEMDVQMLNEGGRNDGVIQRVGRGKYQNIVLKRGMFVDTNKASPAFWSWIMGVLSGVRPVMRYDGTIEVLDHQGAAASRVLARWSFTRGIPAKIVGPQLNAKTGDIAMEELHIAHEGLRLEI